MIPKPPVLFLRPRIAFWPSPSWDGFGRATLQALDDGCYRRASCYDAGGLRWPIEKAVLARRPGLLDRLLPWRQVLVRLHLGRSSRSDVQELIEQLCQVVAGEDYEGIAVASREEFRADLRRARSAQEVMRVVERFDPS